MKATGIVRRIDDLGRVVIPKEIRRTLRIREGDPLEIFVDRDGEVILKKYSPISELGDFAKEYAKQKGYKLVLTYSKAAPGVLYVDPSLDVTADVVKQLNDAYAKDKK